MKKIIILLLIANQMTSLLLAQNCNSANCSQVATLDISTGFDNATNARMNPNDFDDDWILTQVPAAMMPVTLPRTAFVIPRAGGWNGIFPNANWISGIPTNAWPGGASSIRPNNCVPRDVPIIFEKEFCTCSTSNITFNFGIHADNYARVFLIPAGGTPITVYDQQTAGIPLGPGETYCNTTRSFDATPETVSFTASGIPAGQHRIEIHLWDASTQSTGVNLQGSISSDNVAILTDACCGLSLITGRKWEDANCNGTQDAGDSPLAGFTFDLFQGASFLQTSVSDATGYFSFPNIAPGNYTIRETVPPGWMPSNPLTGQTNVTVTNSNNQYVEFLNCKNKMEPIECCETQDYQITSFQLLEIKDFGDNDKAAIEYNITSASPIPVSKIRLSIIDFEFDQNYADCFVCHNHFKGIGNFPGGPAWATPIGGLLPQAHVGWDSDREQIWEAGTATSLQGGQPIRFWVNMPRSRKIPGCRPCVKMCLKFEITDVNCNTCELYQCVNLELPTKEVQERECPNSLDVNN